MNLLRIGEMAARTGTSERALRYYEEIGLLKPAGHSPGGSRRYGEEEVARVLRIRELQDLMGFNLDEIRAFLVNEDRLDSVRDAYRKDENPARRRRLLQEGMVLVEDLRQRVESKLGRLEALRGELDAKMARYHERLSELDRRDAAGGRDSGAGREAGGPRSTSPGEVRGSRSTTSAGRRS